MQCALKYSWNVVFFCHLMTVCEWENQVEEKEELVNYYCDLVIPELLKRNFELLNSNKAEEKIDDEALYSVLAEALGTKTFKELNHCVEFKTKKKIAFSMPFLQSHLGDKAMDWKVLFPL